MHINMYRLCWVLSIKFNIIQYVAISMGTCLVFLIICVRMYMYIQLYIYIIYPVILEYRIEILASQGIPIIELENSYLEYS